LQSARTGIQTALFERPVQAPSVTSGSGDRKFRKQFQDSGTSSEQERRLAVIENLDTQLTEHFRDRLLLDKSLTRQLVSFQANKKRPAVRWYKYKEGFSTPLIDYLLSRYDVSKGTILDPFAGAGTALFVAADAGLNADGIELLPIGQEIIRTRLLIRCLKPAHLKRLKCWADPSLWIAHHHKKELPELRITKGAYSERTVQLMEKYQSAVSVESPEVKQVLEFAMLCVLENISYTRKDGQYLRWDYRSGRRQGVKQFDKGKILDFEPAISAKISEIVSDISASDDPDGLFSQSGNKGSVNLIAGSCLDLLPRARAKSYSAVVTSPPYCNRYDYTRTYGLELALLGVDEDKLRSLRQEMLSCTVENRAKDLVSINPSWKQAIAEADRQELLQCVLRYLDWCLDASLLNNDGIARMVRGYFYEMSCVIFECARVLKPGAPLIMVNDNVRYAGASVSVDLILSALAERLGFTVDQILVLPNGKGNSSQQMGKHGRDALRKCVYVWRRSACLTAAT
jgi:DNA modification methylase